MSLAARHPQMTALASPGQCPNTSSLWVGGPDRFCSCCHLGACLRQAARIQTAVHAFISAPPCINAGVTQSWLDRASHGMAGCFTLFATHFGRLSELASMYPNARVWHLAVSTGAAGERLTYTRQLQPGVADNQHYGLLLASAIGIPAEVWALLADDERDGPSSIDYCLQA